MFEVFASLCADAPVNRKAAGPRIFLILLLVILPRSALAPTVAVFMNTCRIKQKDDNSINGVHAKSELSQKV